MFQAVGIQRNNGMAGFDWAIHKGDTVAADSDLGIPIFVNQEEFILRDRFDLVEGLSGWIHNDRLTGREVVIGARDETTGGAAIPGAGAPAWSWSNNLTEAGVARISGLRALFGHKQWDIGNPDVVVMNQDAGDASDILLGGGGSDIIEGKAGDDIIDGDRWLNVRIAVHANRDGTGPEILSFDSLTSMVGPADLAKLGIASATAMSVTELLFARALVPGQLGIVREVLGGNMAGDIDTAVYRGVRANYTISSNADGSIRVIDNTGADSGTAGDTLRNIERLRFSDVELDLAGEVRPVAFPTGSADTLHGTVWNDTIDGLGGNDSISGHEGSDLLLGAAGDDTLAGGAGDDTLDGGAGADLLVGGDGSDTYRLPAGMGRDTILETGLTGTDTVITGLSYTLGANLENLTLTGAAALAGAGNALGNRIAGNAGANTLAGGEGDDTLLGGAGGDRITGGTGTDIVVFSGARADYAVGFASGSFTIADSVPDRDGTDTVLAVEIFRFADGDFSAAAMRGQFTGTASADTLTGTAGSDTISGLGGNDVLTGLGGDDRLVAGDGTDIVVFSGVRADYAVTFANGTFTVADADADRDGTDTVLGAEIFRFADGDFTTAMMRGMFAGTGSADTLSGGPGNDTINGLEGDDVIDGGAGNDRLVGGAGHDTLVFGAGFGHDTVVGFDWNPAGGGQDRLDISALVTEEFVFADDVGIDLLDGSTVISVGGGTITLAGIGAVGRIDATDFILT
jgi:Ca2+-binding RTX toxin-like protein